MCGFHWPNNNSIQPIRKQTRALDLYAGVTKAQVWGTLGFTVYF